MYVIIMESIGVEKTSTHPFLISVCLLHPPLSSSSSANGACSSALSGPSWSTFADVEDRLWVLSRRSCSLAKDKKPRRRVFDSGTFNLPTRCSTYKRDMSDTKKNNKKTDKKLIAGDM